MGEPVKYKTRKAWNHFGHSHSFTFSTFEGRPYLLDDRICEQLARRLKKAAKRHRFVILAFVFMPDHVHVLIHPMRYPYDIGAILKSIKHSPSLVAHNRGWIDTVLWEPGGGYDRNVFVDQTRTNIIRYIHRNPTKRKLAEEIIDYRWSSANWYVTGEPGEVECRYYSELDGDTMEINELP